MLALSCSLRCSYTASIIVVSSCPVAIITTSLGIPIRHIIVTNVCLAVCECIIWCNGLVIFNISVPFCSWYSIGSLSPTASAIRLISLFILKSLIVFISTIIFLLLYLFNISLANGSNGMIAISLVFCCVIVMVLVLLSYL